MASVTPPLGSAEPDNSEPLKYKTWVLRVSIHCEGCKRKVKRILHSVEGVYTIDVDTRQHRVVVTGNVDASTLLRKLEKSGKHAELWPNFQQYPSQNEQQQQPIQEQQPEQQQQPIQEQQQADEQQNTEPKGAENNHVNCSAQQQPQVKEVRFEGNTPATGNSQNPPGTGGGGGGKKKKKKKGQNGNNTSNNNNGGSGNCNSNGNGGNGEGARNVMEQEGNGGPPSSESHPPTNPPQHPNPSPENMSPPRQYPPNCRVNEYPHTYYAPQPQPQPVYAVSYNTAYPSSAYTASYYSAPLPYSYAYMHQGIDVEPPAPLDWNPNVAPPSDTFEIFSDENPNACSVM